MKYSKLSSHKLVPTLASTFGLQTSAISFAVTYFIMFARVLRTSAIMPRAVPRTPFVRFLSTEIKDAIDKAVQLLPVVLFMKGTPEFPQCGFLRATIQTLGQQGVDPEKFAAYNVLEDEELRNGIKEYSEWPTIPQLYVSGEFIGGCDIVTQMAKLGELADLLEQNDALIPEEDEVVETKITPKSRQ